MSTLSDDLIPTNPNSLPLTITAGVEVGSMGNGTTNTGVPYVTTYYTTNMIGDPGGSTPVINEYTALTIPAFYSGARFLAETLAGLHRCVFQRDKENRDKKIELYDHPLTYLLNDECNYLQTPFATLSTFFLHAVVWSNGYLYIQRNDFGQPIGLFNLCPDRVVAFRSGGQQYYAIDATAGGNKKYVVVEASNIIHLPALSYNGMTGLPMVWLMRQALRIGKSAETFAGKFFDSGANLGGSITSDKAFTDKQIADVQRQMKTNLSGVSKSHEWLVLGGAEVNPFDIQMDKAQNLETRTFSIDDVCRALRLPPHIVYSLGRATWGNLDQLEREVVKYSLANWVTPAEQELKRKLLTTDEIRNERIYVKFDLDCLLRGDPVVQTDNMIKRVNAGISNPDEERAEMDWPPQEGGTGKIYRLPSGSVPASSTPIVPAETPKPGTAPVVASSTRNPITFGDMASLVADVASRVSHKTAKALENAKDKPNFTPWSNVFAQEQAKYVAVSVAPVLETFAKMSGKAVSNDLPAAIGERYSNDLRGYFAAIGRGEASQLPDLGSIILQMGEKTYE